MILLIREYPLTHRASLQDIQLDEHSRATHPAAVFSP